MLKFVSKYMIPNVVKVLVKWTECKHWYTAYSCITQNYILNSEKRDFNNFSHWISVYLLVSYMCVQELNIVYI